MDQEKRMEYLVNSLCEESVHYKNLKVEKEEQPKVLRSLMNIRMPKPASEEFLRIQDEFLKQETMEKGIVNLNEIPTINEQYETSHPFGNRISIWKGDITRLEVGTIVNAANSQMLGCFVPCHGCIDNTIHSAAGIQLREECDELMQNQGHEEATGKAKITKAYNLPCKYVLHTVGPIINGRLTNKDCKLLRSCYESCLTLAEEKRLESIAFCCISTGEFHFPNDKATEIAIQMVEEWLEHSQLKRVIFNVFKDYDLELYEKKLTRRRLLIL